LRRSGTTDGANLCFFSSLHFVAFLSHRRKRGWRSQRGVCACAALSSFRLHAFRPEMTLTTNFNPRVPFLSQRTLLKVIILGDSGYVRPPPLRALVNVTTQNVPEGPRACVARLLPHGAASFASQGYNRNAAAAAVLTASPFKPRAPLHSNHLKRSGGKSLLPSSKTDTTKCCILPPFCLLLLPPPPFPLQPHQQLTASGRRR
jgi:hypothetical protein